MWQKRCHRMELTRVSFRALIPCRKPKSNDNLIHLYYIQWATSLLYSLFDIFGWLQCVVRYPIYT